MNPNHYLAVSIAYLFANRPGWNATAGIGKTLVSSSLIDRVAAKLAAASPDVVGFQEIRGPRPESSGIDQTEYLGIVCPLMVLDRPRQAAVGVAAPNEIGAVLELVTLMLLSPGGLRAIWSSEPTRSKRQAPTVCRCSRPAS